jgi:hypothetical protein
MNYPLPIEIREYFLFTTTFIFITGVITYYNRDYITSFFIFSLVFTSINFWRNPQYGLRRTVDMTMCKIIALYFLINSISFHEFNRVLYECILLVFIIFTIAENMLWSIDSNKWVIFHLAIHIYMAYFPLFIYYVL